MAGSARSVAAIDLFCGAGGLSYGLKKAGLKVVAGVDIDPQCRHPFEKNIRAPFIARDVAAVTAEQLTEMWPAGSTRLLAGCAPCQPFSPYRRGIDTSSEEQWPLLNEFGRLVKATKPELVTMENVPRIGSSAVFAKFVETLDKAGYSWHWKSCHCPDYGLPQSRRRLVLVASLLGPIDVPDGPFASEDYKTVRDTIDSLPDLESGGADESDVLHRTRGLTEINLKRIRASTPGGTWKDWPDDLRAPCHRKASGASFRNVYARMEWDKPAPTITTLCHNFGTGRFGHPIQDRVISLREAAMLQGFPREYEFVAPEAKVTFSHLGRLIGNAVPPPVAEIVGRAILAHVREHQAA